jgi:NADH-quinone oxidoreductase subunit M
VLALVAALALAPGMPLSSWLVELVAEHEPSVGALVTAFTSLVSTAVLLRVTIALVPTGARWASSGVLVVAALSALVAAGAALRRDELGRVAGHLVVATGALSALSAFSLTPQGLTGAIALSIGRALSAPLLVLAVGAVASRTGTPRLSELGGLGRSAPRLAALLGLAIVSSGAIPGGAAFWGAFLALAGWVGRSPHLALLAAAAFGATAVAHTRLARLVVGQAPPALANQPELEPHGGRMPDLFRRERAWALVLVLGVLILTFAPRFVLGATSPAVLDLFRALDPAGPTQVS